MMRGGNDSSGDVASLLREIRDELRQNNVTLQAMKNPQAVIPVVASVPTEAARFA